MANSNLPPSSNTNKTTAFFNNYFEPDYSVSPDISDATVAYFQTITGSADAGRLLAASVIYTALTNKLDPASLIDEFRKIPSGKITEVKTPIPASMINTTYRRIQDIREDKDNFNVGQLFWIPSTDGWYQIALNNNQTKQVVAVSGYRAEIVDTATQLPNPTGTGEKVPYAYNFFAVTYNREKDELTPYLTVLLNSRRAGTSLLALNNRPEVSKYIARAILP